MLLKLLKLTVVAALIAAYAGSTAAARSHPEVRTWLLKHHHYCLVHIIDHEDGTYDPTRYGAGSSYGLPQANPGYKMASVGRDWATNPYTQIRWMKIYVRKYGGECGAWEHWKSVARYYKGDWHGGSY